MTDTNLENEATYLDKIKDLEDKLHKSNQTRQNLHMIMPSKNKIYNGIQGLVLLSFFQMHMVNLYSNFCELFLSFL